MHVAEVTGAVERVETRAYQLGRVANVMEPGGGSEQIGVAAKDRGERPSPRGDTLDMSPTTRKGDFKKLACQVSGPLGFVHDF
jgi:hypothetical protein